ncbi:response regulator [Candidatus Pacearchaeota archaeon]|nr:response regulator [Candidatus Pacearchaeota archaeon]
MKLEKILIADDKEENRNAARQAIPNATVVSSAKEAIAQLTSQQYDLVITDMQMEENLSGLSVVREAMKKATVSYVLSHLGQDHGKQSTGAFPYLHIASRLQGKADPETWKQAFDQISNPKGAQEAYHQSVERMRSRSGGIDLDENILRAIYYPVRI